MDMISITLSDGSKLEGLGVNGTYFTSDEAIDLDAIKSKLNGVTISGTDENNMPVSGTYEHMRVGHSMTWKGKFLFSLKEIAPEELEMIQLKANIEYLAMMTEVDL